MANICQFLELLHHEDRLFVTPVGFAGCLRPINIVNVPICPTSIGKQEALNIKLCRPSEVAVVLSVTIWDVLTRLF